MDIEEQKQIENDFVKKLIDGTIPITGTKDDLLLTLYYFEKSNIFKSIKGRVEINVFKEISTIYLEIRTFLKFKSIEFKPEKELGKKLISFLQEKKFQDKETYKELSDF